MTFKDVYTNISVDTIGLLEDFFQLSSFTARYMIQGLKHEKERSISNQEPEENS